MKFSRRHIRAKNMSIGIVGYGYVGKATSVLGCKGDTAQSGQVQVLVHDINPVTSFFGINSEYTSDISESLWESHAGPMECWAERRLVDDA